MEEIRSAGYKLLFAVSKCTIELTMANASRCAYIAIPLQTSGLSGEAKLYFAAGVQHIAYLQFFVASCSQAHIN